jgi:hypothetical protein
LFCSGTLFNKLPEAFEAFIPEFLVILKPRCRIFDDCWFGMTEALLSLLAPRDQAGPLQYLEVF